MKQRSPHLLFLFFVINLPAHLSSMELSLIDFKTTYTQELINEYAHYGFNYQPDNTVHEAMSHVFNITKQLNKS